MFETKVLISVICFCLMFCNPAKKEFKVAQYSKKKSEVNQDFCNFGVKNKLTHFCTFSKKNVLNLHFLSFSF